MTLAQRLKIAMDAEGLTQKALAERIGVSQAAIQKLTSGKAAGSTRLVEISKALQVNPEWLSVGHGQMRTGALELVPRQEVNGDRNGFLVEVLDIQASAGSGVTVHDEFIETIKSIEYSLDEAHTLFGGRLSENIKMIAVNGDSMSGTFEPRDQIFVDVSVDHFDGDGIYIFILDDRLYIKRLQLQHRRIAVISDNKKYETWYIDTTEIDSMRVAARVLVSQSRAYKFHA